MRMQSKTRPSPKRQQRGAALPLVAVGMLAMLAIAGLALDASHALANKTRLQNTVDAAALAAAKEFDGSGVISAAETAATDLFGLNADGAGNHELNVAHDASEISVAIQWSASLDPFVSAGVGPYVRVIATGFDVDSSLSGVLGITEIGVAASAVAGPSPSVGTACNVAPVVVCADDPLAEDFGFEYGEIQKLKSGSNQTSQLGPGNFQLIELTGTGGNNTRYDLAGAYEDCLTPDDGVTTEPGNKVGPVRAFNTRFGIKSANLSLDKYPPDVVIEQPDPPLTLWKDPVTEEEHIAQKIGNDYVIVDSDTDIFDWEDYQQRVAEHPTTFDYPPPEYGGKGSYERRVLSVPVADCTGELGGGTTDLTISGFACYFMLQKVEAAGTGGQGSIIFGQFIEGCTAGGVPGPDAGPGKGPYVIQLYKDAGSEDS